MSIECITCGKKSEKKKEFFELAGSSGATLWNHICKECAKEIGINNFMKAGFSRKISVMKKYVKMFILILEVVIIHLIVLNNYFINQMMFLIILKNFMKL